MTGNYDKLFLLIKIIHVLFVSSFVCTDYRTSSVLQKNRVHFVKSYPHFVITQCVKKDVSFVNWMKFISFLRNGSDREIDVTWIRASEM